MGYNRERYKTPSNTPHLSKNDHSKVQYRKWMFNE